MRSLTLSLLMLAATALPAFADGDQPEHKETQSASFIMVEPMYMSIVDAGRPAGVLLGEADHGMPVLRDAYVRSLMAFSAAAVRPTVQPDVGLIADRLQRVTDKELGRKGAHVLLAQVAIQSKH
jgi:hypothetical protein